MGSQKQVTWTREETELLVSNIKFNGFELSKLFPNRTYKSVMSKKHRILQDELNDNVQLKITFNEGNDYTFSVNDNVSVVNEPIDDINMILNQSLVRVEELTIENSNLIDKIRLLESRLEEITEKYDTQNHKVESIANETKSRWSIIKKVFM